MSLAGGITVEGGRKTATELLQEHRGFRLAIAFATVALCWGWSLNWASGRSFVGAQTMGEQLWHFAPFFLGLSVSLFCLGWASKLFWDGMIQSKSAARVHSAVGASSGKKPWIVGQEVKAITTVFLAGILLNWAVGFISGNIAPEDARAIFLVSGAALWVSLIGAFFNMLNGKAREGNWRKIAPVLIAPPLVALAFTAILNDPSVPGQRGLLYWGLRIALVAAILFVPASALPGLLPVWLVRRGKYDLALRLDRLFFWAAGNNRSTEGWILVMAGRYEEARSYLKPLAFDKNGHPHLTSMEFFLYALALSIEGEDATAEMLYEAAVQVPQVTGDFHFGLADCLLTQHKDPDRARKLVESVLAGFPVNPRSTQQRANRAQMLAFHAWALASNGSREEAELRLHEAMEGCSGIGNCSLAALQLPVGDTWLTLGETQKARKSFREALTLFPFGDIAMRARKKLELLDQR